MSTQIKRIIILHILMYCCPIIEAPPACLDGCAASDIFDCSPAVPIQTCCDDGDACTFQDECVNPDVSNCVGVPISCPYHQCRTGTCSGGTCSGSFVAAGTVCCFDSSFGQEGQCDASGSCLANTASIAPSISPTQPPSSAPSITPSSAPSISPTQPPSNSPSVSPTQTPSSAPSITPSSAPSISPTQPPSSAPSITPSIAPSISPTQPPSFAPSIAPSIPSMQTSIVAPSLTETQPPTHESMDSIQSGSSSEESMDSIQSESSSEESTEFASILDNSKVLNNGDHQLNVDYKIGLSRTIQNNLVAMFGLVSILIFGSIYCWKQNRAIEYEIKDEVSSVQLHMNE